VDETAGVVVGGAGAGVDVGGAGGGDGGGCGFAGGCGLAGGCGCAGGCGFAGGRGFAGAGSGLGFGCECRFGSGGVEACWWVTGTVREANMAVLVVACDEGVSERLLEWATWVFATWIRRAGRVLTATERRATGLGGRSRSCAPGEWACTDPEVVGEPGDVDDPLALGTFAGSTAGVVATATGVDEGDCKTGLAAR
jgi:hypothetical protein